MTGDMDHPRMRGEDSECQSSTCCHRGSPPHARGRPLTFGNMRLDLGITPACAGKTMVKVRCVWRPSGSPPHARGRPPDWVEPLAYSRITPACAGKTVMPNLAQHNTRDHPRMRGEDA